MAQQGLQHKHKWQPITFSWHST